MKKKSFFSKKANFHSVVMNSLVKIHQKGTEVLLFFLGLFPGEDQVKHES